MSRFFEPITDLAPGERFAMMKEVFYYGVKIHRVGSGRWRLTRNLP